MPTPLRSRGREAVVLVQVHDAACHQCRRYLAELSAGGIDLVWWQGRVVVVVPGTLADASALRPSVDPSFVVVSDEDRRAVLGDGATVVIADRYGQIYHVGSAGSVHTLPTPRELEEWLKFLAIQCPE